MALLDDVLNGSNVAAGLVVGAGALFDDWLLVPLGDLEYPFLHGAGTTANSTGCGAPFHDDALVPELHLLFHRGLDDISANAITPLGRGFADGQLLIHDRDDLFRLCGCPCGFCPHLIGSPSGIATAYLWADACRPADTCAGGSIHHHALDGCSVLSSREGCRDCE